MTKVPNRANGGNARAEKLTAAQRKEISIQALKSKEYRKSLPVATHGSTDAPLKIGSIEIPCYVLEDGRRVLTMRGLQKSLGFSSGGGKDGARKIPSFLQSLSKKGLQINGLDVRADSPFDFLLPGSRSIATAYEATILVDICDTVFAAKNAGIIADGSPYFLQCETLVRGLARVGIVALVDEVTGYQRDRSKDALSTILEQFVAKELQPYVKTFPPDFYEELFRLRGLEYTLDRPRLKPMYFGHLTNDIVYDRLAPCLVEELKKLSSKEDRKTHLHRCLTNEIGHPKLRERLASVVSIMKLSDNYQDFIQKLNRLHPRLQTSKEAVLDMQDR